MQIAGVVSMVVFYLAVFGFGVWGSRKRKGDDSAEGLLLAGRSIPLLFGVFTMTATWVGGGYINGTAEAVYDTARGIVWTQAPWGYAIALILGGLLFAGPMRRLRFTTLLDLFERRYGQRVAAGLFIPALVGDIFWSAAILTALGTTFGTILGFDFTTSILLSAAVAIGYTMMGGLWSVAYTDVIQLIFILVGLALAIPFAMEHTGGLSALWEGYQEKFGPSAALFPPWEAWSGGAGWGNYAWNWLDFALLLIFGGIPWQVYFQRVLSCRDDKTAVRLSLMAGLGCALMAIPAGLIGAIGATVDWSTISAGAPETPALVLPYVLFHLTPPVIAIIGLGAVAAAVMSSVDSSILSASSMFSWNVYRTLIRPEASDREIQQVMRVAILAIGVAATALALSVGSVYALWYLCADLVYVILFPQLVMALFVKSSNAVGAVSGASVGLFLRLGGGEATLGLPGFLPYPMQDPTLGSLFPFRTTAMLASLLTIYLVSRLTASSSPPRPLELTEAAASSEDSTLEVP